MSLIKQPLYPPDRQPHVTAERQAAHASPTRVAVRLSSCYLLCSSFPPPRPPITQPYRAYISHWIYYETIMAEIISKQTWQWPKPQMLITDCCWSQIGRRGLGVGSSAAELLPLSVGTWQLSRKYICLWWFPEMPSGLLRSTLVFNSYKNWF